MDPGCVCVLWWACVCFHMHVLLELLGETVSADAGQWSGRRGWGVSVQAVSRLEGDRQDTDCFAGKGWSLQSRHIPHAHG